MGQIGHLLFGGANGLLQIIGHFTKDVRCSIKRLFRVKTDCFSYRLFQKVLTFLIVNVTWVFFKADNIKMAVAIVANMLKIGNVWTLFDHSLLRIGIDGKEWLILVVALAILFGVDYAHERGIRLRQKLSEQNCWFRWGVYIGVTMGILLFGVYGPEFSASEFIYFQF